MARTSKRGIDSTTAKWAKQHGIKIWEGTDGRWFATVGNDGDTMSIGATARDAFSAAMKIKNPNAELPPAPDDKTRGKVKTLHTETGRATSTKPPFEEVSREKRQASVPDSEKPTEQPTTSGGEQASQAPAASEAPIKARRKNVAKGDLSGVNSEIKRVIYEYPTKTPDEIMTVLQQRGFTSTRASVLSIGAGFRNSMAVLSEIGALKDPLPKIES